MMDYNWAMHASNYWVCDGIIQGGQDNNEEAWDAATALHQELRLEDYSSNRLPSFGDVLSTPPNRWIFHFNIQTVPPESTSFFLAVDIGSDPPLPSLPDDMFHQSDKLRVLKLCHCTFNFTSPPFHCCRSLRFLGLDNCKDQPREQEEKQQRPAMEFFQSLWVLDIFYTDWELALSPEIIKQMAANIREVHIMKGRIWCSNLAWRRLWNLRKLRVIEPTCPWKTGDMDEFTDMGKLELLDLSRNITMQVLPSLSGATGLKTLVLDGCVGLSHVGPEGLPPFLESFSLDAGAGEDHNKAAKISRISLVGSARLVNFRLRGSLPNLEELDLSSTSVKTLDLKDQVVKVTRLQQMILLGCEKLHSILWPEKGLPQLRVLCIASLVCRVRIELRQACATLMDMRFVQSLVLKSCDKFCWNNDRFRLSMCGPSTSKDDRHNCHKEKMGPNITGQIIGNLLIPNPAYLYSCPRLVFVLPLSHLSSRDSYLPNLETLHIVYCGDLRQVFPVDPVSLNRIATDDRKKGILEFPRLKHIHLHELPKLQQICEAKMSVPMLQTIWVRGCWGLRRLPAVSRHYQDNRPVVYCEKDWWGKLEWDGKDVGHDPSLFDLRPSQYYNKPLPRGSVLR